MFCTKYIRFWAAATLVVYVLGYFAFQVHSLEFQHIECAEHGSHHASFEESGAVPVAGLNHLPAGEGEHDHCHVFNLYESETSFTPLSALADIQHTQTALENVWSVAPANHTRSEILRLAPKTSPPA